MSDLQGELLLCWGESMSLLTPQVRNNSLLTPTVTASRGLQPQTKLSLGPHQQTFVVLTKLRGKSPIRIGFNVTVGF